MSLGSLVDFEHKVQRATDRIQRKGMKVDVDYTTQLGERLSSEAQQWRDVAATLGVENVNAGAQVAEALIAHGAELTEKTKKSGAWKTDDKVLHSVDPGEGPLSSLIQAILKAKQLEKRRASYVDGTLENVDVRGRVHASINSLGARTSRMSVSDPALQQLPSDEALIRRCFVAEDGYTIITCDYDQVEFRIAGQLSGEPKIILAAQQGQSIHELTANQLFGNPYTPRQYRLAKNTGLGFLFGGGAKTLSRQAEIPLTDAQGVISRYREEFPRLAEWKKEITESVLRDALTERQYRYYRRLWKDMWDYEEDDPRRYQIRSKMDDICRGRSGTVVTPTGRRIKVDAGRAYSGINYIVQSTARDILAAGLLRLMEIPDLAETIIMVVHDEVLGEVPEDKARLYCEAFSTLMTTQFGAVPLTASAEVAGMSWGSKYESKR